jgi:hypothetical protein
MTEADWGQSTKPKQMLEALRASGRATERKLRLFAVAVCRQAWPLLTDRRSRRAVEVAERVADAGGGRGALRLAEREAVAMLPRTSITCPSGQAAAAAAAAAVHVKAAEAARLASEWAGVAHGNLEFEESGDLSRAEMQERARATWDAGAVALLRCVFGPVLFRPLPQVAPAVLAWDGGTVVKLAQTVYDEREQPAGTLDAARLAVLADALEEAGCTNQSITDHLRGPGPHVRGCWAVDLILGKQ